ncbi:hypothetical protein EVAR_26485_1 [Eumeta japonica]|uniref:Uncharacterized protein n=1 Tax=Eumeta variegata TaxID=151549 RepID=A0A4C1V8P9_EUMVA|nr:hypothetical protein EVAR_26485_1 [Eumeta japonica]
MVPLSGNTITILAAGVRPSYALCAIFCYVEKKNCNDLPSAVFPINYRGNVQEKTLFHPKRPMARRMSLTQIVSQINVITVELAEPVINSGKGWRFIMKSQP